MAIQKSNYTQIPNDILALMPEMEDTELRVTLALCRSTFGWQKMRDRVSLTQLVDLTGLSRQGVITGIAAAVQRGTINKYDTPSGNEYEVNVVDQQDTASQMNGLGLVKPVDQKTGLLVQPVDTQKKVLNKKKETITADADKNLSIANATKPEAIHPPTRTDDMTVKASTKKADDILMAHVARSEVGRLKNWDLTCAQIEEYAAALGKPKKVIRALADLRGLVSAGANAAGLRGYGKDSDLLEILRADIAPEDVRRMAEKDAHDTHAKNPKRGDYWASELVQAIRMTKAAAQKPTVIYVPEFN